MSAINKQLGTFKSHPTETVTWAAVEWNGANYLVSFADAFPDELHSLDDGGFLKDEDHQIKQGETIEQAVSRAMKMIESAKAKHFEDGYSSQE